MSMQLIVPSLVALLAVGLGCRSDVEPTPPPPATKTHEVAAEGAMCKEHGVLEALCTKCNPALVAVFRAKGDFCEEHGLPESVCPVCHPERGGKLSEDIALGGDGAPADGTRIKLKTRETAARAGIETVQAVAQTNAAGVAALARLSYDATKLARVNARAPGVVRAIKVDVGTPVKKGAALAAIESADVGADRARLAAARARLSVARENHERQTSLQTEGIVARKTLSAAQQELSDAESELGALNASLSLVGSAPEAGGSAGYMLTAPLAGVVTERSATIGKLVGTEEVLFEIVDTSTLWAELEINERDLPLVAVGQTVTLTMDGQAGPPLSATLAYIAPSIDPHTRTARARVSLQNPQGTLRANMYGQARIAVDGAQAGVTVPRAAVQRAKDVFLAFVRIGDDEYETRRVQVGATRDDMIEITKGVLVGEQVVTTGSFLLKTETLKDSIGAGCCEGE